MAGWVCYTRKILVSAFSSIADELEQTALDFNDAVQLLSASKSPSAPQEDEQSSSTTTTNTTIATIVSHDHCKECDLDLQPDTHLHQRELERSREVNIATGTHYVPTTQQPQTIGFPAALHSRLSQSSPSLSPLATMSMKGSHSTSGAPKRSRNRDSYLAYQSFTRQKLQKLPSLHSKLSASSPCLIHVSPRIRHSSKRQLDEHPTDSKSQKMAHLSNDSESETKQEAEKNGNYHPTALKMAYRQDDSNYCYKILPKIGSKLPGKVIRATSSTQLADSSEKLQDDEILSPPEHFENSESDQPSGPDSEENQEGEHENLAVVQPSTTVMVKHEAHRPSRWVILSPITSILSFALTRMAHAVMVILREESQQNREAGQGQGRMSLEQRALTYGDDQRVLADDYDNESQDVQTSSSYRHDMVISAEPAGSLWLDVQEPQEMESSMIRSTYSTESFEIIDLAWQETDSVSHVAITFTNTHVTSTDPGVAVPKMDRKIPHQIPFEYTTQCRTSSESLMSSAEFVNFDFHDLIANRKMETLNPLGNDEHIVPDIQTQDDLYQSYLVLHNDIPEIQVNNDALDKSSENVKGGVEEKDESAGNNGADEEGGDDDEEDDVDDIDDDGSASFTIISENDDEEFIIF